MIFGFSPQDGTPFAGTIERRESRSHLELAAWSQPLERDALYSVGDVRRQPKFESAANEIRARIRAHAARQDDDLELARHELAYKKVTEEHVLEELRNVFQTTVGGILQKLEAFAVPENRTAIAFSRNDDRSLLDGLPEAAAGLQYLPIIESMGRGTSLPAVLHDDEQWGY